MLPINAIPLEIPLLFLFSLDLNWSPQDQHEVINASSQFARAISLAGGHSVTILPVSHGNLHAILDSYNPVDYIVFNWCDELPGINNSEWLIAEYLESRGFTFTGAGSATLALAQDKYRMKKVMNSFGIPTPRWKLFHRVTKSGWNHFPAIVKPANLHCSEGIDRFAIVETEAELKNRIQYILEHFRQPALVEDFIDGREFHISLWGNGNIEVLPPAEMDFSFFNDLHDRICSYEAKFVPSSLQYKNIRTLLPAPVTEGELHKIKEVCLAAYRVSGCRDYARIDLRMKDGIVYVLDVNPNADISPDTSIASAAEYAGYTYGEFGNRLVHFAMQRHHILGKQTAGKTSSA